MSKTIKTYDVEKLYFEFLASYPFMNDKSRKKMRKFMYNVSLHLCAILRRNFLQMIKLCLIIYCIWLLSPYSSVHKDLASIGTLFLGIAALLALFIPKDYWKREQQLAAAEILSLFRDFITKANQIILQPDLYQYKGYYPFKIPEQHGKKHMPNYWTRPNRLISNYMGKLTLGLNKPLGILVGKEYYQVLKLLERLEEECRDITGWLQAKLGDRLDKQSIIQQFESAKYPENLKSILKEAEEILLPVIASEH